MKLMNLVAFVLSVVFTSSFSFSQDGWVEQESGTSHILHSVSFVNEFTGWIVGGTHGGGGFVILNTTDGGNVWETQLAGGGLALEGVYFLDELRGWAVGEGGIIIHTSDGGLTWNGQVSNDPHNLYEVIFLDENTGWIGGDWQTLLHTTNGGTTWEQQTIASPRDLNTLVFLDSQNGWAAGIGGIFRTTNGGGTWTSQYSETTSRQINGLYFVNQLNGWAADGNWGAPGGGFLLHTTDGGETWLEENVGVNNNLNDVFFIDEDNGWVTGGWYDDPAVILRTSDGGSTWNMQFDHPTIFLTEFTFVNSGKGWTVGSNGTILYTSTGGNPLPPSLDPVAYYPFNGNADDESGNGNHGTVFGANLTVDRFGNPGAAYSFDGTEYISVPNSSSLQSGQEFSMACWFVVDGPSGSDFIGLLSKAEASLSGEAGPRIALHQPGLTGPIYYAYDCSGGQEMEFGRWYFGVFTADGTMVSAFLDGVELCSGAIIPSWTFANSNPMTIGGQNGTFGGWNLNGRIDDVRIFNRPLSPDEILVLYNENTNPLTSYGVHYGSTGNVEPSNPGALISINPMTGAGTLIGPTGIVGDAGPSVRALAIKSTGEMYAMSHTASSDLYSVNASTGAGTFVANTGLLRPGDICFDAEDVLYAVDETNILYTIDETTGVRTVVGATGVALAGLAYDPSDGTMYGSGSADDIYTVDLGTGATTLVGTTGLAGNTPDIHFDQAGNLFGVKRGAGGVYDYITIDKTTGAGTLIGSTGFVAVVGLATRLVPPSAIPCADVANFQTRCQGGGTIQARLTLANTNYTGEIVEFSIDGSPYQVTVGSSGRANLSVGIFDLGLHTVEVTIPAGCIDPRTVRCRSGVAMEGDELWDDEVELDIPTATTLLGNYPNPFNPSTTLRYALAEPGLVSLKVYNMLGQLVRTIVDEHQVEGYHEAMWDGRNESGATVATGIYVYRMVAGSFVETKRMLLVK